jgi:hypothetical protein
MFKVLNELKMKKGVGVKGSAPTSLRRWPRESATPNQAMQRTAGRLNDTDWKSNRTDGAGKFLKL